MEHFSLNEVNAWLARTKYDAQVIEPDLETSVANYGFGILTLRYDVATWVDSGSTPDLVRHALSMLYAAWYLQRQVSDDALNETGYPVRLEQRAIALLNGIATGLIDLPGVDPDPELSTQAPSFFPTDASTQLAEDDPFDPEGSPLAFNMGTRF